MSFPIKPIYLLADSQLLFWSEDGALFLQRIRDDIDKENPKAAYIGASNGDQPEFFSIFEAAMESIGITDCRMIFSDYQSEDRDFLNEADIILLAGGDVAMGWRAFEQTGMGQDIIQRYYGSATLIGISAGAVHLGLKGWSGEMPEDEDDLFDTFKLIPFVLDAHDEANQWQRLRKLVSVSDEYIKGMGLPTGGGLVYHPDHTIQPIRHSIVEFYRQDEDVVQTLLFPGSEETGEAAD